jgi:DNA-binding transcriptional ArsR family regulator
MRTAIETMMARARVLCSETRLSLWFALGRDGQRPCELARSHDISPSTVRHHMKLLERERLVEIVGAGAHRVYRQTDTQLVLATRAELEAAGM